MARAPDRKTRRACLADRSRSVGASCAGRSGTDPHSPPTWPAGLRCEHAAPLRADAVPPCGRAAGRHEPACARSAGGCASRGRRGGCRGRGSCQRMRRIRRLRAQARKASSQAATPPRRAGWDAAAKTDVRVAAPKPSDASARPDASKRRTSAPPDGERWGRSLRLQGQPPWLASSSRCRPASRVRPGWSGCWHGCARHSSARAHRPHLRHCVPTDRSATSRTPARHRRAAQQAAHRGETSRPLPSGWTAVRPRPKRAGAGPRRRAGGQPGGVARAGGRVARTAGQGAGRRQGRAAPADAPGRPGRGDGRRRAHRRHRQPEGVFHQACLPAVRHQLPRAGPTHVQLQQQARLVHQLRGHRPDADTRTAQGAGRQRA